MDNIVKIFGVDVDKLSFSSVVEKVEGFLKDNKITNPKTIYTPNTEIVMKARKENHFRDILNEGDLVIPDGIGLVYASKIKKKALPERVTGYDLSIKMIEIADKLGYNLFLLGGEKGVAEKANQVLKEKYEKLNICGYQHGFFKGTHIGYKGHQEEKEIIERINKSNADILFVGLGAPKQELWIHENKDKLKCKIAIGNGGTIDILSGKVAPTPKIFQKLGLEWFYRLMKNPKRIKRQLILPLFVLIVLFSRKKVVE